MATIERAIPVGGAALNFKVVGSVAEPANPAENTIWVQTSTPVTGWAFAPENPWAETFSLMIYAAYNPANNYLPVKIYDPDNNFEVLADQNVTGQAFTNQRLTFTAPGGHRGELVCSHYPAANPPFTGTVYIDGIEVSTVAFGGSPSGEWSDDQTVSITLADAIGDGAVWIKTGSTTSVAGFNAMKKNALFVYPTGAAQYTAAGAWAPVGVTVYQQGAWVSLEKCVFDNGGPTWYTGGFTAVWPASTTIGSTLNASAGGDNTQAGWYTTQAIDLTNVTALQLDCTVINTGNGFTRFMVGSNTTVNYNDQGTALLTNPANGASLDVSKLSGPYYVKVYAWASTGYSTITIRKIKVVE